MFINVLVTGIDLWHSSLGIQSVGNKINLPKIRFSHVVLDCTQIAFSMISYEWNSGMTYANDEEGDENSDSFQERIRTRE